MKVSPSLYGAGLADLCGTLGMLGSAGATHVHVDVMDGHFVPRQDFGPSVVKAVRGLTDLTVDVHLMVEHPERCLGEYVQSGADIVTVHHEATPHVYRCLQQLHAVGVKAGVALNPGTSSAMIGSYADLLDQVLVMTCNPGVGGESFIRAMTRKVAEVAELRKSLGAHFQIEVDGGVDAASARECAKAGADIVVCGGYIFGANDPAQRIRELLQEDGREEDGL
ncbi:ribulose-phosphate 3-epimerase [Olsenella sp. oral taxon 809 str. F0356]|uniref:ribulose-phosphate 3-epimerase n=1 Tax=Olsenella sp. oral taxon 809 TaxID=661086 RepID=UPI000231EFB9|nr:ribulose-phosphate 3-epimerase [Olsenella sp. oral taxon 809]EHF02588.1 ribulose-phosphate 3-epimerase [Olsenella sp. oral taxon 809 str. F0356]